ncbi:AEC family transporter [Bordetella genomosp. 12]|uniref:Transporter n=1 Tax=Bordetella genomosp. 12 TaxID=463035 RepID=A0A261VJW6_9BORD|nr:AEC family transporter [Bordetella genomosp. 12]OZI74434.1 transporter [Bordetella genomosp. 12]
MSAVVNATLPVFALILTGWLAARMRVLGPTATDALNRYVAYLSLPALLFRAMAQARMDDMLHWGFIAAFWGGICITFGVTMAVAGRRAPLTDRTIEGLAAAYANAGYMGIPLCLVVLGPDSLPPAIITTLLTACALFACAIALIEYDQHRQRHWGATLYKVGRALARNPLLIAPVAGALVAGLDVSLPQGLDRYVELLGASASPCALITIGLFLAQAQPAVGSTSVGRLVAGKLLLQPLITAILAFWVFSMPPLWAWCAVLISALPMGTGPFMLAQLYGRAAGNTSRAILLSTLLSVITISALVAWIQQFHPL